MIVSITAGCEKSMSCRETLTYPPYVTAFAVRREIVIFCDTSSAFSSAAAPADPCTATDVPCVTRGRNHVAAGKAFGPIS